MAHKTRVGGANYNIEGGKCRVSGTNYTIEKGRTRVNGTNYDINFKKPLSDFSVGESIFLNVNGVSKEFLIIHQGLPSSMYDSSCNGTWLLMKDIYEKRAWDSSDSDYANSDIRSYLNSTFLGMFDSDIRSAISTVKIPYDTGNGSTETIASGSSGLSTKIFLLSAYELGWTKSTDSAVPADGVCLNYFSGCAQKDSKRIGYYNKTATAWWLRSPLTKMSDWAMAVSTNGSATFTQCSTSYGVRPALILPSNTLV